MIEETFFFAARFKELGDSLGMLRRITLKWVKYYTFFPFDIAGTNLMPNGTMRFYAFMLNYS